MRIVVLVKRVPDTASLFKVGADGRSVDLAGLKYVMSPYDEHAVEEAVKLKESCGAEAIIVSAGPVESKETIRAGLAMGADSGVLVVCPGDGLTPRGTAHALAAVLRELAPDLVLAGKQAVDDDASQVPERVAELLNWPHVSTITQLAISGATATVRREIEGGHYEYETPLPAVFSTQKGINVPRYPSLPNIMKSKKKEIREIALSSLGLPETALACGMTVESAALPRQNRLGRVLTGDLEQQVRELVSILREQEKVL